MGWIGTFISEVFPDLKYSAKSSTNSTLEIELERDPQYEVVIEIVVMGGKCPRHRTTSLGLEYRGLDLIESLGLKKSPHLTDYFGPEAEPRECLIIGHEIQIAFTIERLSI